MSLIKKMGHWIFTDREYKNAIFNFLTAETKDTKISTIGQWSGRMLELVGYHVRKLTIRLWYLARYEFEHQIRVEFRAEI
jgi:hypothetical protein